MCAVCFLHCVVTLAWLSWWNSAHSQRESVFSRVQQFTGGRTPLSCPLGAHEGLGSTVTNRTLCGSLLPALGSELQWALCSSFVKERRLLHCKTVFWRLHTTSLPVRGPCRTQRRRSQIAVHIVRIFAELTHKGSGRFFFAKTQESIKTQDCTCETHKVLQRTAVHSARTLLGCTPLNGALRWNLGIHAGLIINGESHNS